MSVYGFRRWRVEASDGSLLPLSVHEAAPWTFNQQPESTCLCGEYNFLRSGSNYTRISEGRPGHPYPSIYSGCGYYLHSRPILPCWCPDPNHPRHGAVGIVRGWGRIVEHEDGWRVQYAQVLGLVDFTGELDPRYTAARYPDVDTLYSEWSPNVRTWARDVVDWCGHRPWPMTLFYGSHIFQRLRLDDGDVCLTPTGSRVNRHGSLSELRAQAAQMRREIDQVRDCQRMRDEMIRLRNLL